MNERILKTLDFEQVKQQIRQYLVTENGQELLEKLQPIDNEVTIQTWLNETADGIKVLRLRGGLPIPKIVSIKMHMKRIEIGADLNGIELAQISRVLSTTSEVKRFFNELKENEIDLLRLYHWEQQLTSIPEINQRLKTAIDEDGRVTDEASPELRGLRQAVRRSEQQIRSVLEQIVRGKQAKYLSDALITMRNERYVIPVKQEYRSQFGGVVHDQSTTGQTLFVEPKQVVELNNKLRQQQLAEYVEVERILAELSAELVPYQNEIQHNAYVLGQFDFINAKALYAKHFRAVVPQVSNEKYVDFKQARHPLIDQAQVIPNDIQIGDKYKTIVITGPNTGGKTITLKTLGLLQLMGQAGLPILVAEDSMMGIFTEIFADIGDEQSIEQSLSTFSSHMTNIVTILKQANQDSLVLFDELGAGTDPQEGAALAIAILDNLGTTGSTVMATTHYPELKVYGYNRVQTTNASMEFDIESLKPTYRLLIGVPGRSNAFEISSRLGLDETIVQSAKQLIDGESQDLNEMIADLEKHRKMSESEYEELHTQLKEAKALQADLKTAYEKLASERDEQIAKARTKANNLVKEAQNEAEKIIADLRQKQAMNQHVKDHELIEAKAQLQNLEQPEHLRKNKVLQRAKREKALKAGDEVLVQSYGQRGTLIKKVGNDWQVEIGILKMKLPESDLQSVAPAKEPKQRVVSGMRRANNAAVSNQIDLRGKRYEEALNEVDRYIDAALLAGHSRVTIVHGKGTGALQAGVKDYLQKHRSVKSFHYAPANQGGTGATLVDFK